MSLGDYFDDVLAAARAGGAWAWESLYRDLAGPVTGYLRSRGAPDVEDVVSETFLSVARDIHRFSGDESDFRAWVFTIAHRRMQDAFRKRGRQVPIVDGEAGLDVAETAWLGNTEADAMNALSLIEVESIIAHLSEAQRDVVLLRVVGDLSVAETAQALGRSEGAVKAIQSRALKVLRKKLSDGASPFRGDER
ncbi:RNA polymerase sigma factor [Demequina capsici]|uniref:RNA polymerase sigma factor n=1 Tax=Demequina capsici TaxID=3075620 RepID=A0AA96F9S6_9MICO|nr:MULTISPECIES: RNA polymerase sigma factor [unclassified Demequina]WNM25360.1 RNA polymerase sigma factor [Demequina sp. OYTSA14]WNM28240.1 RNA polymerase sigma factor [Demequina sp. PMTSA13]